MSETQTLRYSVSAEPSAPRPVRLDVDRLAKAGITMGQLSKIAAMMGCHVAVHVVEKEAKP